MSFEQSPPPSGEAPPVVRLRLADGSFESRPLGSHEQIANERQRNCIHRMTWRPFPPEFALPPRTERGVCGDCDFGTLRRRPATTAEARAEAVAHRREVRRGRVGARLFHLVLLLVIAAVAGFVLFTPLGWSLFNELYFQSGTP